MRLWINYNALPIILFCTSLGIPSKLCRIQTSVFNSLYGQHFILMGQFISGSGLSTLAVALSVTNIELIVYPPLFLCPFTHSLSGVSPGQIFYKLFSKCWPQQGKDRIGSHAWLISALTVSKIVIKRKWLLDDDIEPCSRLSKPFPFEMNKSWTIRLTQRGKKLYDALKRKYSHFQQTTKAKKLVRMPNARQTHFCCWPSCCSRAISWMRCCSTVLQQFLTARVLRYLGCFTHRLQTFIFPLLRLESWNRGWACK